MSSDRSFAVPGWWRRRGGCAPGQTGRHLTHGPELPPPPSSSSSPVVEMAPSSSDVSRSQPDRGQVVDLLDDPDFWDGRKLDIAEHGTDRSRGVEVACPLCHNEWKVDLLW